MQRTFIYRFARTLFMFMETVEGFDMDRDVPKYMENPKAMEWDTLMRTFQEPVPGALAGGTWAEMREIYTQDLPPAKGWSARFFVLCSGGL